MPYMTFVMYGFFILEYLIPLSALTGLSIVRNSVILNSAQWTKIGSAPGAAVAKKWLGRILYEQRI